MDRTPETSQILFVNVQNLLDDTEINHHLSLLSTHNIKSNFFDTTGKAQASVEDFTSFVIIVLNETLVQQYLGGILTNAAWDAIKSTMLKVWQATLGKKYYIIRAHAEPEPRDVTLGIELSVAKMSLGSSSTW